MIFTISYNFVNRQKFIEQFPEKFPTIFP